MAQRITDRMLEDRVAGMNEWLGTLYQVGAAYGGVRLEELLSPETGAIRTITGFMSRPDLWLFLDGFLTGADKVAKKLGRVLR